MSETTPTAKVLFRVVDEEGGANVETLWAYDLGNDHYRLANLPFFAYGVSWLDVVAAPFDPDEGFPMFEQVVSKSGNRTMRILFESEGEEKEKILRGLTELGCEFEGLNPTYIALTLAPHVSLNAVVDYLIESGIDWEYADPTQDELFPPEG